MSYRRAMVRGLGWLGAVQIVSAGVWQVAGIALATILGPNDFGFFGLAMIAIAVVAIPGDLGLTVEVVRREDFDSIVSTARRLRWFIAAGLSGIALLMGAAVAIVFEVPSFLWVVAALSTIFPATALAFGPRASLTRSLDFRSLAIADTSGKLAGPISSVALALLGFGYWSLAFGFLASTWISALSVWLLHPVKANRPYDRALARILITSGKFVSTAALFGFLLATADNIAVGGAFGVAALGVYSLSYSLGVSVPRNASSLVDTVLFPAFSRMNKDIDRLRRGYLTTMRYVAYFIIPAAALILTLSPTFVELILGPRWIGAAPAMQILSLAGLAFAISVPAGSILLALGEAKLVTRSNIHGTLVLLIALLVAVFFRVFLLVSVAAVAAALAYFLTMTHLAGRITRASWVDVLRVIAKPIFASITGALPTIATLLLFPQSLITLLVAAAVGILGYAGVLEITSRGEFSASIKEITTMMGR